MDISVGGSLTLTADPANILSFDIEIEIDDVPLLGDILSLDYYRGQDGFGYSDSITLGSGLDTITFLNSEPGDPPGATEPPILGIEGLYLGHVGVTGLVSGVVNLLDDALLEPAIELLSPIGAIAFAGLLPALPGLPIPGIPDTGLGTILDLGDGTQIHVPIL